MKATRQREVGKIGGYTHVYSNAMGKGHLRYDLEENVLVGDWSSPEPTQPTVVTEVSEEARIIRAEKKADDVAKMSLAELKAEVFRLKLDVNMTAPNPGVLVMRLRNAIRACMKKT